MRELLTAIGMEAILRVNSLAGVKVGVQCGSPSNRVEWQLYQAELNDDGA